MRNRKYLEPAYSVIKIFSGPGGSLAKGIDAVSAITGKDRTWVYRWMRPKEKGGTGGLIPFAEDQRKLLDHARRRHLPLRPEDFFDGTRAA